MTSACGSCKHGHDTRPGGGKASPGTVWCTQRSLQMGKTRQMPCFIPSGGRKPNHCVECKRARIHTPNGSPPAIGHIWCDKRHMELPKQRSMECFE